MTTMNRSELINEMVGETGLSRLETTRIVDSVFRIIARELACGSDVRITDFGSFKISQRAARNGRNPKTGMRLMVAAKTQAKFKAAKALDSTLNAPVRLTGARRRA